MVEGRVNKIEPLVFGWVDHCRIDYQYFTIFVYLKCVLLHAMLGVFFTCLLHCAKAVKTIETGGALAALTGRNCEHCGGKT